MKIYKNGKMRLLLNIYIDTITFKQKNVQSVDIGRVNYPNPTQKIENHHRTAADQQKAHIQRNRGNTRATQI